MIKTQLIYLTDSYTKEATAKILQFTTKGSTASIILDKTIFYPQGGGQPSDHGTISSPKGKLKVTHVSYNSGQPQHIGKLTGTLSKGDSVKLELDWDRRYLLMRDHSAGHIIHEAIIEHHPELRALDANHGISKQHYVKYDNIIDQTELEEFQSTLKEIIAANEPITTKFMKRPQMEKLGITTPPDLPKNKPLRILQIGSRPPMPDGGTQLKSTSEAGKVTLTEIEYVDGNSLVHYQISGSSITKPKPGPKANSKPKTKPKAKLKEISLKEFKSRLSDLSDRFKSDTSKLSPQKLQTKHLGKKGAINALTKFIPSLPPKDRAAAGKLLNLSKQKLAKEIKHQTSNIKHSSQQSWLDVTAPGTPIPQGHLHPVTQAIDEITRIFEKIGFTRVRYPEIDWDYYVFESLNMPPNHPARDEWETFFIDTPKHDKLGQLVLTTHTSNGQVREMERLGKPPIRMINIAKCYRRQQDVTHTAMFHQFEGLVVDQGISIQNLKGTIDHFARHFYGPRAKSRIRPFHFQFTEPSFEVDFSCTMCSGKGCKFCKSGWHEVGGAGMVHPNVLKAGGIDPNKYTGFAFGWGVERTYTLKPGLKLDDIRPLYQNNLDFLSQF